MKIKHAEVELRQNETTTIRMLLPLWEVPVLEAVHGSNKVTVLAEKLVVRNKPDASTEFERLANRYRESRNDEGFKGPKYVTMVYGDFSTGVRNLGNAIDAACGTFVGQTPAVEFETCEIPTPKAGVLTEAPAEVAKPKRTRRTKAQIDADNAAKLAATAEDIIG